MVDRGLPIRYQGLLGLLMDDPNRINGWVKLIDGKKCYLQYEDYIKNNILLNNNELKKYWKQILAMPSYKRRKLILTTCMIAIILKTLICITYIVCIPIINKM